MKRWQERNDSRPNVRGSLLPPDRGRKLHVHPLTKRYADQIARAGNVKNNFTAKNETLKLKRKGSRHVFPDQRDGHHSLFSIN